MLCLLGLFDDDLHCCLRLYTVESSEGMGLEKKREEEVGVRFKVLAWMDGGIK